MRDWVTNVRTTHYLLGSVLGAHPYPTMVRDFHRVIGREARAQILKAEGKLPAAIIACVGGGSNAIGAFYDFINDKKVRLIGVERAGAATSWAIMRRGFAEGLREFCRGLFLRAAGFGWADSFDAFGFGGVGLSVDWAGARGFARCGAGGVCVGLGYGSFGGYYSTGADGGIIPALESAHAVADVLKRAPRMKKSEIVIVNVSGRGDKDIGIMRENLKLD